MWERKAQTPDTERRAELLIDVQRMSKIYNEGRENEVRALDDISLQVSWGEFLCILGQSGSGKSTLMNILGCLDIPTYGSYHLNGQRYEAVCAVRYPQPGDRVYLSGL